MLYSIPYPFRFNPWKHHLSWVLYQIQNFKNNIGDQNTRVDLIEIIKTINSNYVDIYIGRLSPEQIIQAIQGELKDLQVFKRLDFSIWINKNEFQFVTIHDGSVWVLREGLEKDRYIHVHPARNSPNQIRIHGNSWKTAVITKIYYPSINIFNLQTINEMRKIQLALSPIKNLNKNQRLLTQITQ